MAKNIELGSTSPTKLEVYVNKLFLKSATEVKGFNPFGVVDVALRNDFFGIDEFQFWTPRLVDLSPIGWDLTLRPTKDSLLCVPKGGNFLRRLLSTKIIGPNNLKPVRDCGVKEVDDKGYLLEKKTGRLPAPLTIDVSFNRERNINIKRDVKVRLENPDYRGREVMFISFLVGGQFIGELNRRFVLSKLNIPELITEGPTIPDCMVLDLLTKKQIRRSIELLAANSEVIGRYF